MSDQPPVTPYPAAPPTQPGALPVAEPATKWPTVLGIIGIIVGVLGAMSAAWGIVSFSLFPEMMRAMPPEAVAAMEKMKGLTIALSAVGLPVAVLLLASGIGLVRRRRWSVSTAKIWAALRILVAIAGSVGGVLMQDAMMQGNPGMAGMPAGFMRTMQMIGFAWGCGLPVFFLIWLSRAKIKAEVASWR
jgi:hypothetical protein